VGEDMHRIFRRLLDTATGETRSIIAVFIDIRDFSPFSQKYDSFDIAMFIKRVYINIIDSYFNFASFYKSTGDGLLLTIPFSANNMEEMIQKTIVNCMACHCEFSNICSGDHMINFTVPDRIGIGVARGSACCLISGKKIIDYSGRLLNLTSRLTALAKPSGIVIDQSLGINFLDKDTRNNFEKQDVYLDGIAEATPITVYFTKAFTKIPERNRRPIAEKSWQHKQDVRPLRDITKFHRFRYDLESEPTSAKDIEVTLTYPTIRKGKLQKGYTTALKFEDFEYRLEAGKPVVSLDLEKLRKRLEEDQVKQNMNVHIDIAYVEK
jgi:class 3 adenylate cyclase